MSIRKLVRVRSTAAVIAAAATVLLTGCVGGAATAGSADATTLHLVGYAVPKEANNAIQKKFAETPEGKDVTWQESYGPSGDQSRAVVNGLQADYVNFSLEGDVTRLVKAGLVDQSWNSGPTKGMVSDSTVVIAVQKGNPLGIKDWSDLTKPGVKIVTPNPASSGSARWNILAAYQQVIANGGTDAEAKGYLTKFFNHVVALPGSGRDATNAFLQGSANVLISYENEAILARQSGEDFDYILPNATIKIENPGAVLKSANPKAKAYLDFVLSPAGQEEFVKKGFRPVIAGTPISEVAGANDPAKPFPVPPELFTISDLGGWDAVNAKFFDEGGLVPEIQKATGRSQ
jgi:sulfate/thiosulfate transport system substrate-binding protein